MSTLYQTPVSCPSCGATRMVEIADSLNANRMPASREHVLARTLFRSTCGCGNELVVLHPLLYADFDRGLWIQVAMEEDRPRFVELEAAALEAFRQAFDPSTFPVLSAFAALVRPRIVFGYEELREKVVAADAGLDDVLVEALKLEILAARPDFVLDHVELLVLDAAGETLRFVLFASGDAGELEPFGELEVARSAYDSIAARRETVRRALPRLFEGTYVHLARYRFQPEDEGESIDDGPADVTPG